jgi:leader peptidase (prepilin peptidase)/N-methyltransferase
VPAEVVLYCTIAALFGLIIGSFLNVCIYRVPRDLSVVTPRSFCPRCQKQIGWQDNVPVLSYALLKGRCRHCAHPIGLRYPLVELTTALLFAALVARYGWNWIGFKWCVFAAIMTVLFWVDLEERILPDEFTLGGSAVGLLFAFFTATPGSLGEVFLNGGRPIWRSLLESLGGAFILTVPIASIGLLWGRLRRKEMLGLGDVKLLPCIGIFLGIENGILALLIGSLAGVLLGGGFILLKKKKASEYELPLGSFYCAAALAVPLFVQL